VDARPNPDLTEIREAINVIDERIVKLIGERQAWVEQAGRLKRNQGEDAVRTPTWSTPSFRGCAYWLCRLGLRPRSWSASTAP